MSGKTLVMRKPPRCLDCSHSVGPTGDHRVIWGRVLCRQCPPVHHETSMSLRYEGQWR